MSLVLDSSVALTWCLPGQGSAASLVILRQIQLSGAVVPVIWNIEIANILGLKHRSGVLSSHDLRKSVDLFRLLKITTSESTRYPDIESLLSLMIRVPLTLYDATYLDLALQTGLPLATFDKAMLEAARQQAIITMPIG